MGIRPLRSIHPGSLARGAPIAAALLAQAAQEPGREAQPARLAVAVTDRGRRSGRTIVITIERPEVDSGQALLSCVGGERRDVRNGEDLGLCIVAADHGCQLYIGVRRAVEAVQILCSRYGRLSHLACTAHDGAVAGTRAAVV